jgi:hypothetical protein
MPKVYTGRASIYLRIGTVNIRKQLLRTRIQSRALSEVECELNVPVRGHSETICRLWNDKFSVCYAPGPAYYIEYSSE